MHIELWPIDRPRPYFKNARKWSASAKSKVASSIRAYGFRQPIVVDVHDVICIGHLRLEAAKSLGLTQVPVHVARDLTPAQIRGLRLADNRTNEESEWNEDLLGPELAELSDLGFDLALTGFDVYELDRLLRDPLDEERAEQAPPLPDVAASRLGDLWICGKHRLLCGDATSKDAVGRLLGERTPFLMATDPPYGVSYDPMWREDAGLGRQRQTGKVANDDQVDWTAAYKLFPGDVAYVWHAGVHADEVAAGLTAIGFEIRAQIIWSKQHFVSRAPSMLPTTRVTPVTAHITTRTGLRSVGAGGGHPHHSRVPPGIGNPLHARNYCIVWALHKRGGQKAAGLKYSVTV